MQFNKNSYWSTGNYRYKYIIKIVCTKANHLGGVSDTISTYSSGSGFGTVPSIGVTCSEEGLRGSGSYELGIASLVPILVHSSLGISYELGIASLVPTLVYSSLGISLVLR